MADNFHLRVPPIPQAKSSISAHSIPEHFERLFRNGEFAERDNEESNNVAAIGDRRNAQATGSQPHCWVFGYGSLCWFPGFEYNKCITGYIRGYNRRFWQGNTTHRGTKDKVSCTCF